MDEQGSSREDDNQSLALSYIGSSTQVSKLSSFLSWVNKRQVAFVDIKLPRRSLQVELVATHAEREELNGLSTVWLMNVALSLSSVVDVLSLISWLRILVIVEYDFRKETSKDSSTDQI
ncbi:uncharacterized protein LOC111206068 [Brassica napus]|uniref:uncharacterized protein LOC111206068 n=1 Tax=Brassica napus TaxID=3708 RepID=UPI00207A5881|nr:uncharacterized protein LOC111206068 [Brassica napus]